MSPIILAVIPFGLITGVTSIAVGLSIGQALGMSFLVAAGASQLAAFELMGDGVFIGIIILTVAIINMRLMMYSAALAPHLSHLPLRWRLFLPHLMVDQVFLLSSLRFNENPSMQHKRWYYLGLATCILSVWQIAVVVGVFLGTQIPPEWALDFTVPLVFLALLFPAMIDRPTVIAAVVGGVFAVGLRWLPYNLGFILAALIGVASGYLADSYRPQNKPGSVKGAA